MTNINTLLDDLAAKAKAATVGWEWYDGIDQPRCDHATIARDADGAFLESCSPAVTLALIEVARADDPEPPWNNWYYDDGMPDDELNEAPWHKAWRKRQEARAALQAALEENRG